MAVPTCVAVLRRVGIERKASVSARTFQLLARSRSKAHIRLQTPIRHVSTQPAAEASTERPQTTSSHATEGQSSLAHAVKVNMRSVKSSISIITSSDTGLDPLGEQSAWKGATVASFTTVAMQPFPVVSFNIHIRSSTLEAIRNSGYFTVNVLGHSPNAAYLADLFSKPNEESPFAIADKTLGRKFHAGRNWYLPAQKMRMAKTSSVIPPRLQITGDSTRSKAVLFALLCTTNGMRSLTAGDHVIVVGRVVHVLSSKGTKTFLDAHSLSRDKEIEHEADNLTYQHGRYSADRDGRITHGRVRTPWAHNTARSKHQLPQPDLSSTQESIEEVTDESTTVDEEQSTQQKV